MWEVWIDREMYRKVELTITQDHFGRMEC
jgi:hypothetical protein